jgi:hypothetical protein
VSRACAFLRVHKWDAAYADMAKANKMDATDPQVKEWIPQIRAPATVSAVAARCADREIAKRSRNRGTVSQNI